jgi:hypothetical protein
MRSSRIVGSWGPVRFFTTEIARRTAKEGPREDGFSCMPGSLLSIIRVQFLRPRIDERFREQASNAGTSIAH